MVGSIRIAARLTVLRATVFIPFALLATPGLAQPALPQDSGSTAPAVDATADTAPGDIVVTAQRRSERLQDVPLSVSAVSGEALHNGQINSADRLEQVIPGIRLGRSGSDLRPAIRGTYTENVAVNGDPRIGIYVDDIYQSRTSQVPPIVDLERVEVQKGPQGTLYGRNSFGGNIAFYSAMPKDRFSFGVDGTYGRYNNARVEAFVNVPLTAGVAIRVAGLYERADGYIKNISPIGNDAGGLDTYFFRGTVRIAPPSIPGLEVVARGSYQNYGGSGLGGFYLKSLGTPVDPSTIVAPGGSITRNGVTYTFPNGFNGSTFSGSVLLPVDTRYRDGIADLNGADIGLPVPSDPYTVNDAGNIFNSGSQKAFSGQISYDFGPIKFRSITSYADFNLTRTGGSITPALLNYNYLQTRAQTFTQEVQLLSGDATSPFQYIVGAYYYNDKITETSVSNTNRGYNGTTAPAGQQYYAFNFTYNPILAGQAPINQTTAYDSRNDTQQKIKSYAGYGQLSYTIAQKLTLTAGVRYTSDDKTLLTDAFATTAAGGTGSSYYIEDINDPVNYACGGYVAANAASNANAATIAQAYKIYCGSTTQSFTTYRGAVDYKFSRDHMIYASYSTGAHSGGFNTGVVNNGLIAFNPEKVEAYEVGTKNTLMDGKITINAAFFLNNYRDLQAQTSIPNPQNPASVLALVQNIGRDHAYGLDLETVFHPDRHFTFNVAFNWLHARELDYAVNTFSYGFCSVTGTPPGSNNGGCVNPVSANGAVISNGSGEQNTVQGTPFPNVRTDPGRFIPLLGSNGVQVVSGGIPQYRYVIAGIGSDGTKYVSKKAFSPDYTVQIGGSYRLELGGSGTLTPEVQFYFNSGYILTDLTPTFGNQQAYTKTDLRLTYRTADERFRLQVFVNNVEDSAVISRAVYGANRDLQALYAPPRTYGIAAGVKF